MPTASASSWPAITAPNPSSTTPAATAASPSHSCARGTLPAAKHASAEPNIHAAGRSSAPLTTSAIIGKSCASAGIASGNRCRKQGRPPSPRSSRSTATWDGSSTPTARASPRPRAPPAGRHPASAPRHRPRRGGAAAICTGTPASPRPSSSSSSRIRRSSRPVSAIAERPVSATRSSATAASAGSPRTRSPAAAACTTISPSVWASTSCNWRRSARARVRRPARRPSLPRSAFGLDREPLGVVELFPQRHPKRPRNHPGDQPEHEVGIEGRSATPSPPSQRPMRPARFRARATAVSAVRAGPR